ncbi:MCE family protein [Amycolatopsis sp. K13G38]|uniref:MCE family protein n=1 Tax=Amycolatopsis acididurans TaxID=2724524 RepID=A0ABX1J0R7_9PSEU|nr:MCE family protein [Amycolatopsis acididurans]NKQ53219.1 MCE family protein [Amycolatopsis acididurans]
MSVLRRPLAKLGTFRLLVVLAFVGVCALLFGWMWTSGGGSIPGVTSTPSYQVSFEDPDVLNLVQMSEVQIAGVVAGRVQEIDPKAGGAHVVIGMNPDAAPLHEGVTVRVGIRSLEGPSYVEVQDGKGPVVPAGTALPASAVRPTVDVRALLSSLDGNTRAQLGSLIRGLGSSADGTSQSVSQLMSAFGTLGGQGYTAVDALAGQSRQLQQLAAQASTLLNALDTGRGQIADVVHDAQQVTAATSGQSAAIADTVRQFPGVLTSADAATKKLSQLSGSLSPVASGLHAAAPGLNQALVELPQTTSDLRGLLPALNGTLDESPATLGRVPAVGNDLDDLLPKAQFELRDIDPMLSYMSPFGRDIGAFFANFGAAFSYKDENGDNYLRLMPFFNEQSLKGYPVNTSKLLPIAPLMQTNPYPGAGSAANPQPFAGPAPHLERNGQ